MEAKDIVLWVNKLDDKKVYCIEKYHEEVEKNQYEQSCDNVVELSNIHLTLYDLPFCSAHFAYFASNFPFYLNDSMMYDARNT